MTAPVVAQGADEFNTLGSLNFRNSKFKDAVENFTEAINLAPAEAKYYSNRCAALLMLPVKEHGVQALSDAKKTIQLQPECGKYWGRKGASLYALGHFAESAVAYQEGLARDSTSNCLKKGRDEARQALQSAKLSDFGALEAIEASNKIENKTSKEDDLMLSFMSQIDAVTTGPVSPTKESLKRIVDDSQITDLTGEQHVDRLLQQNHVWKNLNPFYVLCLPVNATDEDIKQRYHKLSARIHPDKMPKQVERAKNAFMEVKKAFTELKNLNRRKLFVALITGAENGVLAERKKLISKGISEKSLPDLESEVAKATMTVFAQNEQRRRMAKKNKVVYIKKARKEEVDAKNIQIEEMKHAKEWASGYEDRVGDWRNFAKSGSSADKRKSLKSSSPLVLKKKQRL